MPPLKPCLDCGDLSPGTRCPRHASAAEAQRNASRSPRGDRYGTAHQSDREVWAERLRLGEIINCRRGEGCLFWPNVRVERGDLWDLGHPDELCSAPTAPEHERCNRSAAGRLSGRRA